MECYPHTSLGEPDAAVDGFSVAFSVESGGWVGWWVNPLMGWMAWVLMGVRFEFKLMADTSIIQLIVAPKNG
jgi:hypothetical protein